MEVVRALKGSVDFYVDKGRVIARSWPRKRRGAPRQAEVWQQHWLREANIAYRQLQPLQRYLFSVMAQQGTFTPRDMFMKHYFGSFPWPTTGKPDNRPPPQAWDPKTVNPYFSIQDIEVDTHPLGGQILRIKVDRPGRFFSYIQEPTTFVPAIHQVSRRGITFNRCWRYTVPENGLAGLMPAAPEPLVYTRNLDFYQPSSGLRYVTVFIYGREDVTGPYFRSFSMLYILRLRPINPVFSGLKGLIGVPRQPGFFNLGPMQSLGIGSGFGDNIFYPTPVRHWFGVQTKLRDRDP